MNIIFLNNPKFLPIFAFQNLIKLVSLLMFLYDLGKNISIQVKSQNLYSFEFTKGFKFLLFFYIIPNFCRYLHSKI